MKNHIINVHEKPPKEFKCEHCSLEFRQLSVLKTHIKAIHEKVKNFHCTQCGKSFSYKKSLEFHEQTHLDISEQTLFKCEICGKDYLWESYLKKHIKVVHRKEKAHSCPQCDYKSGDLSVMKTHISTVHEKQTPFECDICHRKFGRKNKLYRHKKTVHKSLTTETYL